MSNRYPPINVAGVLVEYRPEYHSLFEMVSDSGSSASEFLEKSGVVYQAVVSVIRTIRGVTGTIDTLLERFRALIHAEIARIKTRAFLSNEGLYALGALIAINRLDQQPS